MAAELSGKDAPAKFATWNEGDVTLVVEEREFHVAKSTLCLASPDVFGKMLTGDWKEKDAEKIPLPGKKPAVVEQFLLLISPQYYIPITYSNLPQLLPLLSEYQVTHLVQFCESLLLQRIPSAFTYYDDGPMCELDTSNIIECVCKEMNGVNLKDWLWKSKYHNQRYPWWSIVLTLLGIARFFNLNRLEETTMNLLLSHKRDSVWSSSIGKYPSSGHSYFHPFGIPATLRSNNGTSITFCLCGLEDHPFWTELSDKEMAQVSLAFIKFQEDFTA